MSSTMSPARIGLVGCVKQKTSAPARAQDLYTSVLFRGRRRWVEETCDRWFILSAEHGVLRPDEIVEPYDVALAAMGRAERRAWAERVMAQLRNTLGDLGSYVFELHAGQNYVDFGVREGLLAAGAQVSAPADHLSQGRQLALYKAGPSGAAPPRSVWPAPGTPHDGAVPEITLVSMNAIGPFSWRWPEITEQFEHGWAAIVLVNGFERHVRHGVGSRTVYGRRRVHSVTWVEGQPLVEGVEADDLTTTETLLSLIKVDKRHLKPGEPIPDGYGAFHRDVMADAVTGPYSPRSIAARIRLGDVEGWARHALLRAHYWGRLTRVPQPRASMPPLTAPGPAPALPPTSAAPDAQRRAIVAALLGLGKDGPATGAPATVQFTTNPAADELLFANPFAFLLAVIFDQGIPAERAWLAPFLLRERLGHLDPARIAAEKDAVAAAVAAAPKLHRYVNTLPGWVSRAGGRVVADYAGDARAIWAGNPAAAEVRRRLERFAGIGQKKAAMAVEILERDLGVPIADLHGSDIAYDIHVRRVFLRTRLAERDDRDHMVQVAREMHPSRPGEMDFPTWRVGRTWCHPGVPDCAGCRLTEVCPKDLERAAAVTSA